ncbi:MAG: DUF2203 domain-containing protein [Deltaproteobacteria bacterium]|nr:DUF2203 domain-containing protein [Deltaproteobacteria bacterium]
MADRLFSIEEANALIPKLELLMARLQQSAAQLRRSIEALAAETGRAANDLSGSDIVTLRPGLRPLIVEMEQLVGEIEACGGEFKGLDLGLVDFPAEVDGEVVLLCWQFGEKEIAYWHALEAGFSGRKPLSRQRDRRKYLQ